MNRPTVVSAAEWQAARDELLVEEKKLTHELDALAARRRRLPMVRLSSAHRFTAPDGTEASFADLFDGARQLVVYHFMLRPGQAPDDLCGGCATFTDNLAATAAPHLAARNTRLILMSPAPQAQIDPIRRRMGWTVPWYSSLDGLYAEIDQNGGFELAVYLHDGDDIFRTYTTTGRGVDRIRLDFNLLDLTPYGRQEQWEDSPAGWPQDPTMMWLRPRGGY